MFLEDLKANQEAEVRSLCEFVGLDPAKLPSAGTGRYQPRRPATSGSTTGQIPWGLTHDGALPCLAPEGHSLASALSGHAQQTWDKDKDYPEFRETPEFRRKLMNYLQQVSAQFLEEQGKPSDFWSFDVD